MARIIAITNQKGGVGKTTTAVNLGASLGSYGKNVLLVDLDPQSNSTSGVGVVPAEVTRSSYTMLAGGCSPREAILDTKASGLRVLPANRDLIGAEIEMVPLENRELILKERLFALDSEHDFIIVDCPPSLGLLTVNALAACEGVIIPLQCEYYAMEGVSALIETLEMVRASLNPLLALEGVLLTMFDTRNSICHQVAEQARECFGDKVFRTVIPRNVRLSESPSFGLPILLYDPGSRGAQSYLELAREMLARQSSAQGDDRRSEA
ncbi:MAG TPA: ParA family protein [Candidatus Binatia bacterium]|nr:ParA family protein [Candidatus Binatia bacterium]